MLNSFYLKRLTLIFLNVSLVTSVVSLGWFRASTKLAYSVWKLGSMLALFITRYWAAHGKYSSVTSFFNSSVCYQIIISSIVTCYSSLSHILRDLFQNKSKLSIYRNIFKKLSIHNTCTVVHKYSWVSIFRDSMKISV